MRLALHRTFKYSTALIARRSFSALNYCRIMTPTLVIACKWNWLQSRRSPSRDSTDFLMIVKIDFDNVQFLPFLLLGGRKLQSLVSNEGQVKWKLLTMLFPVTWKQSNSQQGFRSRSSKISPFSFGKMLRDDKK